MHTIAKLRQCGPCSADRAVRSVERSGRSETGGRLEYINGVRCSRVAMSKIVEKWQTQKRNPYNYDAMSNINMFDDNRKEDFFKYKKDGNEKAYKHTVYFSPEVTDQCSHAYLLNKCINAQNKVAYKPDDRKANTFFYDAQKAFRKWRGHYILKKVTKNQHHGIFDIEKFNNDEFKFIVEFRLMNDTIDKTVGDYDDGGFLHGFSDISASENINLDLITPVNIIDTILRADIDTDDFKRHINEEAELNYDFIKGILGDTKKHLLGVEDQRLFLGYKMTDENARFSKFKGKDLEVDGHVCKFHRNIFMPTQAKMYQNPVVVEKMTVDFLRLGLPCMHVDCVLKYKKAKNDVVKMMWTVSKIHKSYSNALNIFYTSHLQKYASVDRVDKESDDEESDEEDGDDEESDEGDSDDEESDEDSKKKDIEDDVGKDKRSNKDKKTTGFHNLPEKQTEVRKIEYDYYDKTITECVVDSEKYTKSNLQGLLDLHAELINKVIPRKVDTDNPDDGFTNVPCPTGGPAAGAAFSG
jgi:hypothetical protein